MKPVLPIKAHVDIGLRKLKDAGMSVFFEPAAYRLIQRCNLHVLGLIAFGWCGSATATEIVIKNVGDALFVAADSKGSEGTVTLDGVRGGVSFGTCKILQVGRNQFFSFSGMRGGDFYNVREEALSAGGIGGSIADISDRFVKAIMPKVELYRHHLNLAETQGLTTVAFYGREGGHGVCIKSTFFKSSSDSEIAVKRQVCPPSCEPFVSLGDRGGELADWAARNPRIYDQRSAREVECLVRGAVRISAGAVGGSISVA